MRVTPVAVKETILIKITNNNNTRVPNLRPSQSAHDRDAVYISQYLHLAIKEIFYNDYIHYKRRNSKLFLKIGFFLRKFLPNLGELRALVSRKI